MASDEVVIPANNVSFTDFCTLLETIENKKTKPEKEKVLTNFFNNLRIKFANVSGKKVRQNVLFFVYLANQPNDIY